MNTLLSDLSFYLFFLPFLLILSTHAPTIQSHPICVDFHFPTARNISFCSAYVNSTCCSHAQDTNVSMLFSAELTPLAQQQFPLCASYHKQVLCTACGTVSSSLCWFLFGILLRSIWLCACACVYAVYALSDHQTLINQFAVHTYIQIHWQLICSMLKVLTRPSVGRNQFFVLHSVTVTLQRVEMHP